MWNNLRWRPHQSGGINSRLIANEDAPVVAATPARGGAFAVWLYERLALQKVGGERELISQKLYDGQQSSVPPFTRKA
ncbi:MAG: hypothetical protein R3B90_10485 [Planctomycetaceae bacterium]